MQPGTGNRPRGNTSSGMYSRGNAGGFDVRGQPYRSPEQQVTPQEREAVLMAAGRLAAEYLVNRGDLPPHVLENRPPPPPPPPIPPLGGPPAFAPQYHVPPGVWTFALHSHGPGRRPPPQPHQAWPRPFHSQGQQRPLAPRRRFPGPRQFQGGRGPFPKRQRPFPYGPAPPKSRHAGQAAAPLVAVSDKKQEDDNDHNAAAGEADESQPTAQPDVRASGQQQTLEPAKQASSSSSLGANASESS